MRAAPGTAGDRQGLAIQNRIFRGNGDFRCPDSAFLVTRFPHTPRASD